MPMGFTKAEAQSLYDKVNKLHLESMDAEFDGSFDSSRHLTENEFELFCNLIAKFLKLFRDGEY